jgi:outer membrane immunogenic protein
MNKLLATVAVVVGFGSTAAMAADMVDAPVYDWTGAYIGANGGFGFGGTDKVGISGVGANGTLSISGGEAGIQAGFNRQYNSIVFGLEADIQLSDISDSKTNLVTAKDTVDYFGTLRGRVGFALDNAMIYGTGGLAYGGMNYKISSPAGLSDKYTDIGYALGGGIEYALDSQWSVKGEYLYVNLGSKVLSNGVNSTKATPDFHLARIGLNYRF